jgi:CBS-domain-containing membrane protein
MRKKGESSMARFFLFVAAAWIFRSMTQPRAPQQAQRPKDNNFANPKPKPQVEFRDVQDAKFEDITEQHNVSQ